MQAITTAAAVLLAALWIWFLARGRARGVLKRVALRITLLALAGLLVGVSAERGLLARASTGFRVALVFAVLIVTVGYLYLTRFCDACGRMVRNLRLQTCPRCGAYLPLHGMTTRLRKPGDDRGWNPADRRPRPPRSRHPEGPSA
ncbi:MAG TPA: hypothetical protein VEP66_18315 [Myxococcales bacterium]|nr:hypothetical protein [Myxococcales bacterium]